MRGLAIAVGASTANAPADREQDGRAMGRLLAPLQSIFDDNRRRDAVDFCRRV